MTPHLTLKPGASLCTLAPAGLRILGALDLCAQRLALTLTITSGSEDRGRAPTDPHMTGDALDISVNGLSATEVRVLYSMLTTTLGPAFTVLLEAPPAYASPALSDLLYRNASATALHMHIQRKKGTTWPPV